jgi:predicted lipoprotein with Yx(FWY)xxD motif
VIVALLAVALAPAALGAQVPYTVGIGGNDDLGEFLVASDGLTLYLFTPDAPGVSNCNDACADAWPPLRVEAGETPTADMGISGELTLITRDDGSEQVALNGVPLYYFAGDSAAGDANGQGLNDIWYVLDATGQAIQSPAQETPTPTATPEATAAPEATATPAPATAPDAGKAGNLGLFSAGDGDGYLGVIALVIGTGILVFGGRLLSSRR